MRAAVLSCGPSLARLDPGRVVGYDLALGINGAAERHPCDWWVAGDDETIRRFRGQARGLFAMQLALDRLHRTNESHLVEPYEIRVWDATEIAALSPPRGWNTWSATAAVVFAASLGADAITLYGVDMAGAEDFSGRACVGRNPERWIEERRDFDALTRWVTARGITMGRAA